MNEILFHYHKVNPTTWVYLSSLLTIGLFFKFSRLWSVRNLDLIGLIALAPGLLLVHYGQETVDPSIEQVGYIWLFTMGGLFIIRLLLDPMMVRRPLLEPNLSMGGMTFIGISLLVFLMANVITSKPAVEDLVGATAAEQLLAREQPAEGDDLLARYGPGYPLLHTLSSYPTQRIFVESPESPTQSKVELDVSRQRAREAATRTMAIISHLAIVLGMVLIGYNHFDNIKTGIAAALLYLLLPYTSIFTGRVEHVLPAALMIWAVVAYRRPLVAGMLMGLAIGVSYYPLFLLPLWFSFYWQRGLMRFLAGVASMIALLVGSLALTSVDVDAFLGRTRAMFGWTLPRRHGLDGFWDADFRDPAYRIPVLAAFVVLSGSLALWPAQKNLGTLMSCSAALMLGAQFWHGHGGGLLMAWYLPLMLLTIFRPNLEDRVALTVLGQGWTSRHRLRLRSVDQAA